MDDTDALAMQTRRVDLAGLEIWDFYSGKALHDRWNPDIQFVMWNEHEEDYLGTSCAAPVFSDRLKVLMQTNQLCAGIDFYPLRVVHEDGRPLQRYWHVNILAVEGALDMDRSLYKWGHLPQFAKEPVLMLIKPVIRLSAVRQRHLFRLAEFTPGVYVSGTFRRLCLDHNCTGMVFLKQAVV